MEKEFVKSKQALALRELGFDKPCLGYYVGKDKEVYVSNKDVMAPFNPDLDSKVMFRAPTYSQAFRWLYQKLDIEKGLMPLDTEPQQLLLKELIDKVSSKHLLA